MKDSFFPNDYKRLESKHANYCGLRLLLPMILFVALPTVIYLEGIIFCSLLISLICWVAVYTHKLDKEREKVKAGVIMTKEANALKGLDKIKKTLPEAKEYYFKNEQVKYQYKIAESAKSKSYHWVNQKIIFNSTLETDIVSGSINFYLSEDGTDWVQKTVLKKDCNFILCEEDEERFEYDVEFLLPEICTNPYLEENLKCKTTYYRYPGIQVRYTGKYNIYITKENFSKLTIS